jgi:hypothetical protein
MKTEMLFPRIKKSPNRVFSVVLTVDEIEEIKSLIFSLKECDCQRSEGMDTVGLPLLEAIIEASSKPGYIE